MSSPPHSDVVGSWEPREAATVPPYSLGGFGAETEEHTMMASASSREAGTSRRRRVQFEIPEPEGLRFDAVLEASRSRRKYLRQVDKLKKRLVKDNTHQYIADFERQVAPEVLVVGSVSVEAARKEEKHIRELRKKVAKAEELVHQANLKTIKVARKTALANLRSELEARLDKRAEREKQRIKAHQLRLKYMRKAFEESKIQLEKVLDQRKKEVSNEYGTLLDADALYGLSDGRRKKVDWSKEVQPVQLRIGLLRAVKDKLPKGEYIMLASVYDRLGGQRFTWKRIRDGEEEQVDLSTDCALHDEYNPDCESCIGRVAATRAVSHGGNFRDLELKFRQILTAVCPSKRNMKPYMVFLFELIHVRHESCPYNRVVGWSAFPLCDPKFDVVKGKHKAPMLRGPYDPSIDNYQKLDGVMRNDLENWIGNLYFEIRHMPRSMRGMNKTEFDVELEFTSKLLHLNYAERMAEERRKLMNWDEGSFFSDSDASEISDSEDDERQSLLSGSDRDVDEDSIFSSYSGREEDLDSQSEYEVASEAGDALFASSRRSSGKRSRKSGGFAIVPMFGEEESEGSSSDSDSDGLSRRRTPRSARSSGSKRRKSGRDSSRSSSRGGPSGSNVRVSTSTATAKTSANILVAEGSEGSSPQVEEGRLGGEDSSRRSEESGILEPVSGRSSHLRRSGLIEEVEDEDADASVQGSEGLHPPDSDTMSSRTMSSVTDSLPNNVMEQERKKQAAVLEYHQQRRVAPGLTYFVHGDDVEKSEFFLHDDLPPEAGGDGGKYKRRLYVQRQAPTLAQKLERHRYSIRQPSSYRGRKEASSKLGYIWRAIISDLSLSHPTSVYFWGMIFMFLLVLWMRLYTHYFGQWLLLQGIGVSIFRYKPEFITVKLEYQWQLLDVGIEIGMVMFGVLFNILILTFLVFFAWLSQKVMGNFLDWGSRFVIAFGVAVVLDPVLLVIVDCAIGNWEYGDAFKLYNHFQFEENTGVLGIFLTIFFDALLILLALFILYNYILRIHMNGLMYDVYVRLHAPETAFFVPGDLEVSTRELHYIVDKAEKWRGSHGERRKTVVHDFVLLDPSDEAWSETSTQVVVYTLRKDGQSLGDYRRFIRLNDGTITEIFDEGSMGSREYTKFTRFVFNTLSDDEEEGEGAGAEGDEDESEIREDGRFRFEGDDHPWNSEDEAGFVEEVGHRGNP